MRHFAQTHKLSLSEIWFIGDDVQDLEAMDIVAWAAAPADARPRSPPLKQDCVASRRPAAMERSVKYSTPFLRTKKRTPDAQGDQAF